MRALSRALFVDYEARDVAGIDDVVNRLDAFEPLKGTKP